LSKRAGVLGEASMPARPQVWPQPASKHKRTQKRLGTSLTLPYNNPTFSAIFVYFLVKNPPIKLQLLRRLGDSASFSSLLEIGVISKRLYAIYFVWYQWP
jgi:hypothetical protein